MPARTRSVSNINESELVAKMLVADGRLPSDSFDQHFRMRSLSNLGSNMPNRQRSETGMNMQTRTRSDSVSLSRRLKQGRTRFESIDQSQSPRTQFLIEEEVEKTCRQWFMSKLRGNRSTMVIKQEVLDQFQRYTQMGGDVATPHDDASTVRYTGEKGVGVEYTIKDGILYWKLEDRLKKKVTKLTYSGGKPAKLKDQDGDGPDDVPWHVVEKVKELADSIGVQNNLPQDRGEIFRNDGFTSEDISRVFYAHIKPIPSEKLDIMTNLRLDKTCGLKNIKDLAVADSSDGEPKIPEKQFWFFYLLASVLFNMASLLFMNWGVFHAYVRGLERTLVDLELTQNLTHSTVEASQASKSAMEKTYVNFIFSKNIHDQQLQQTFLNIAAIVGCGECLGLLGLTCMSFVHLCTFLGICEKSEYRQYIAIYKLMQRRLPEFSTFSSLRLMHKVHPTLTYLELFNHMTLSSCTTKLGRYITGAWFIAYRSMFGAMGLCALAVKILAVGLMLLNPMCSILFKFCALLSLMVQCMGCIHMEHVLQDRIMLLVFGGQDSCYSDDELAYRNVFQARLAKEIWRVFRWGEGRTPKQESRDSRDTPKSSDWQNGEDVHLLKAEAGQSHSEGEGICKTFQRSLKGIYHALVMLATFDHYDLQWILVQGSMNLEHNEVNDAGFAVTQHAGRYYCGRTFANGFCCEPGVFGESCPSCCRFYKEAVFREEVEQKKLSDLIEKVNELRRDRRVEDAEVDEAINVGDDIDAPTKKSLIDFIVRKAHREDVPIDFSKDRSTSHVRGESDFSEACLLGPKPIENSLISVAHKLEPIEEDDMKETKTETGFSHRTSEAITERSDRKEDRKSSGSEATSERSQARRSEEQKASASEDRRDSLYSIKEDSSAQEGFSCSISIGSDHSGRSTGIPAITRAISRFDPAYATYQPMAFQQTEWAGGE